MVRRAAGPASRYTVGVTSVALAPVASSPAVLARMRAQRTQNTGPEIALRRELHALGLRFRLHRVFRWGKVRRTIDLVLPGARVAVEVHGCFWHGCEKCRRRKVGANGQWWSDKIARNRRRDADTARRLRAAGWSVVTVWEHEPPSAAARRVLRVVERKQRAAPAAA